MKHGQRGIGLIQIMIALAGVAGISYTIMQQGDVDNKIKIKNNFDQNLESISSVIRSDLSDILNCSASFAGKTIGTLAAPTELSLNDGIFKGNLNLNNQIIRGSKLFGIRTPNSNAIYVDRMQILSRPFIYFDNATNAYVTGPNQDVVRIFYRAGSINATGTPKNLNIRGLGATEKNLDLPLVVKLNANVIETCYFDPLNSVKISCEKIAGAIWNEVTKKCDLPNAIQSSELIQLWLTNTGTLNVNKPADKANGQVTCQKSSKRCSRTNMDCNLPACPANHYQSAPWEWDRKQSMWDYACMKSANCMYVSQPSGRIVKP